MSDKSRFRHVPHTTPAATRVVALLVLFLVTAAVANADTAEGIAAFEAGDYEQAYAELKPEAEEGDAQAQLYIGRMHTYGYAGEKNAERAFEWYVKAAEAGLAEAQAIVGYAYDRGIGITLDDVRAVDWYGKAAEQGNVSAQRNLGLMYREGEGMEKDYKQAAKWFYKAAEQGDTVAAYQLGTAYREGRGLEKEYAQAARWFQKAVDQNHVGAMNALSWHYELGRGVEQDLDEAYRLRKSALAGGHDGPISHYRMASILKKRAEKTGSEEDYAEAIPHLREAAERGHLLSILDLGFAYRNGDGVDRDQVEAYGWLRLAKARGVKGLESAMLRRMRARMGHKKRDAARARFEELQEQTDEMPL